MVTVEKADIVRGRVFTLRCGGGIKFVILEKHPDDSVHYAVLASAKVAYGHQGVTEDNKVSEIDRTLLAGGLSSRASWEAFSAGFGDWVTNNDKA